MQWATPAELVGIVDEVGMAAGEYLFSLAIVGGSAWKMEAALARFFRRHLTGQVDFGHQVLLRGLPGVEAGTPPHAVQSVDWYHPTLGELGIAGEELEDVRVSARSWPSGKLPRRRAAPPSPTGPSFSPGSTPSWRWRSGTPSSANSRPANSLWPGRCYAAAPSGWARASPLRGTSTTPKTCSSSPEPSLTGGKIWRNMVADRRKQWERQRRLAAPLALGDPPRAIRSLVHGAAEAARTRPVPSDAILVGEPASPGRASGAVRIVHGPDDFRGFRAGEVLVARLTAPAWTPLFGRAAAVVTDGGTLAAHASLVAREYGIPAVVGTGDATIRLRDGQAVTVDGGAGTVELGR